MARRALVVDDSKTMREMVRSVMDSQGFDIVLAEDGQLGLTASDDGVFDIVISDINMPNMNGYEMIHELRQRPKFRSTPILVLTTEANAEARNRGKSVGATGWLVKPFERESFIGVINRVCR
jgi:two-component system chemotaxis response regulator CheY